MTHPATPIPQGPFEGDDPEFRSDVDAAFADLDSDESARSPRQRVAKIRAVLTALRVAPLESPSPALREQIFELHEKRASLVERWVLEARRIVLELVSPSPAAVVAGFRADEIPMRTFRARFGDASEVWLDLQIDRDPTSVRDRRVRGQVTIDGGASPIAVHAMASEGGKWLASAELEPNGGFALRLSAASVEFIIELADSDDALAVPAIVLRT